ncbi:MAG: hypothetical protein EOP45_18015 [Sphingobacteriaceae bacterium]|nr:MAG: hypothetical protein EOP45_18015 [Sphingobacteriaceae bacterium]
MAFENKLHYTTEPFTYYSNYLDREVKLDAFLPQKIENPSTVTLLLINDGQDMERLGFVEILEELAATGAIEPILAVGIHCDENRRLEYGTADVLDCKQRGSRARFHRRFVLEELIPYLHRQYHPDQFKEIALIVEIKKNVSTYTPRHTFAANWIRNGGNIIVLKDILGHESLATTQIYVNLLKEDLKREAEGVYQRSIFHNTTN